MAQAQAVVVTERGAFDMEAGAFAEFAGETSLDPAAWWQGADADCVGEVGLGFLQPVEVIGDGEVFGDVALPGGHGAAIGLGPAGHASFTSFCSTALGFSGVTPGNRLPQPVFATSPT